MSSSGDDMEIAPALGQAWDGDWRARIKGRLEERGCESVTAFADKHPLLSTVQLAEKLSTDVEGRINRSDVAAYQLANVWRGESLSAGPSAVERMARRMLVGQLHADLPQGWDAIGAAQSEDIAGDLASAITAWNRQLGDQLDDEVEMVFRALLDEGREGRLARDWLPANADDPMLAAIFGRYWTRGE